MIKMPDGRVWVDPGERFPFQCPQCKDFITWHPLPVVKCECGNVGTPAEFSQVRFLMEDEPKVH